MTRFLLLTTLLLATSATAAPVPKVKPKAFEAPDAKTIAAFRELGATYCVVSERCPNNLSFVALPDEEQNPDTRGQLPAFTFDKWPQAGLPDITIPFGLELEIGAHDIPDDLGKKTTKWKNLRVLSLRLWPVTDEDMGKLAQLTSLPDTVSVQVKCLNCEITDTGLAKLKDVKCLTALTLCGAEKVTDRGLTQLAKLERLTCLRAISTKLTVAGFRHLPKLTCLEVDTTDEAVKGIGQLTGLTALLLWGNFPDERLAELGRLTQLRVLSVASETATDTSFLRKLDKLTDLTLELGKLTDDKLKPITEHTGLRHLRVINAQIATAGAKLIAKLDRLECLTLCTTDKGLAELAGLTRLTRLDLAGSEITNAGLKNCLRMTELRELDLSGTKITDAGLRELTGFLKLEAMWVNSTTVTARAIAELRKELPECIVFKATPFGG